MSPGSGASSRKMSVFQVSRMRTRLFVPSGVVTVSPTRKGRCLSQFGASGAPASERSGRNPIFKYTTLMPACRATASTGKHATLGPEVVLHVDRDDGSACWVNGDRFGLRVDGHERCARSHQNLLPIVPVQSLRPG